ncbi:MAG: hypothetical protein ACI4OR_00145 [Alphaproteobacteria bacterium]
MKKFKKTLMAGAMASVLMTTTPGMAAGSWIGLGTSLVGLVYGGLMTFWNGGIIVWMLATNLDPAQLVAEGMVLSQMYHIKDKWDPEPAEEYEQAAQSNGGSSGSASGGVSYNSAIQKLPFQAASLQNVGIEAVEVGADLSEITSEDARKKILENLAWLQEKGSGNTSSATENKKGTGAGSCGASYSVCVREMTIKEESAVSTSQRVNEQNYGTAGITHAELGLKSVQQAIANDGDSSVEKEGTGAASENVTLAAGEVTSVQNLSELIGTGANTVASMKIVALMNLELAQRLNQGNMMQGSALTIEAARAFPNISNLTD